MTPGIYAVGSYDHAEAIIMSWWKENRAAIHQGGRYEIEIRGTFHMRARLATEGRSITLTEWQSVLGCWFRERAYGIPLADNWRYLDSDDILLFYPVGQFNVRLIAPELL